MPRSWSNKDERKYEHIKDSARSRGTTSSRAEELAARTVNKARREEGRTKSGKKRTSGTGNPRAPLQERSKDELYNTAKELGIAGRSKMNKKDLVNAIHRHT